MSTVQINQKVKTPIGEGVVQGRYLKSGEDEAVLVRIVITEENRHLLGSPSCMTPRAYASALFVLKESEVTA